MDFCLGHHQADAHCTEAEQMLRGLGVWGRCGAGVPTAQWGAWCQWASLLGHYGHKEGEKDKSKPIGFICTHVHTVLLATGDK